MEKLTYKQPFDEIPKQDNPQECGDKTICICLMDGIDVGHETYEIIKTGGKKAERLGLAYGLKNAEKFVSGF